MITCDDSALSVQNSIFNLSRKIKSCLFAEFKWTWTILSNMAPERGMVKLHIPSIHQLLVVYPAGEPKTYTNLQLGKKCLKALENVDIPFYCQKPDRRLSGQYDRFIQHANLSIASTHQSKVCCQIKFWQFWITCLLRWRIWRRKEYLSPLRLIKWLKQAAYVTDF